MALIPKLMYRARDAQGNEGMFFVLANREGPDAKVLFRPDSDEVPLQEEYVPDLLCWGRAAMLKENVVVDYDRRIPIEEGTTEVRVMRASMVTAPKMRLGGGRCE